MEKGLEQVPQESSSIIGQILSKLDELTGQLGKTRNRVKTLEATVREEKQIRESLEKRVRKLRELKDFRKNMRTSERRRFTQ